MPGDDLAVAAVEKSGGSYHSSVPFPSMSASYPGLRAGFGDGELDGSGMISTMLQTLRAVVSLTLTLNC
jgi:hypothetical protein